jgi:hypothetical protein
MKTVVAAFLLAFQPRGDAINGRLARSGKIVSGEIDVGVFASCVNVVGETVEGDCQFRIDNRFRSTNLRRNLKNKDADFFLTFEDCNLKGDISGK